MILSSFKSTMSTPFDFSEIINHPSFIDGGVPANIMIYFIIAAIFLLLAVILTVLYNLFDKMKKDKIYLKIILILYFGAILLAGLSHIVFLYLLE